MNFYNNFQKLIYLKSQIFIIFIAIVNIAFFCTQLHGQSLIERYGIKKYGNTIEQSFHSANRIRQDKYGRIVFDQHGKNFMYDGSYSHSLEGLKGECKLISKDGSFWMKNDQKYLTYHSKRNQIINIKKYFSKNLNFMFEHENNFYLLTNEGFVQFKKGKDSLEFVKIFFTKSADTKAMFIYKDTTFIKYRDYSAYILKGDTIINKYKPQINSSFQNDIIYLPNDRLLILNGDKIKYFDKNSAIYKLITKIGDKNIIKAFVDKSDNVWLSIRTESAKGIHYVESGSESLKHIDLSIDEKTFIVDIYQDIEGSIWIGTLGEGLIQIYEKAIHIINKKSGLSSDNVWSVSQNKNNDILFSNACGGIDILNDEGKISHINDENCQEAIFTDSKNRLWVNEKGLSLFENNKKVKNYQKESGLYSRSPKSIFEDKNGVIWVGTRKVIHKFENGLFTQYTVPNIEENDVVFNIIPTRDEGLLIATTSDKIFKFLNGKFYEYKENFGKVNKLFIDREQNIWLATSKNGLYHFKNEKFVKIIGSPLSIHQLQDDNVGNLWGSCDQNRIFLVEKKDLLNGKIQNISYFSEKNGLPFLDCNIHLQPSTIILTNGNIIFTGIEGAILIEVEKLLYKNSNKINTLYYKGEKQIDNQKTIELSYGENDIALELRPVLLHPNKNISYQYFYKDKWIDIDENNFLRLNNIIYGLHEIKIKVKIGKDEWREIEPIKIKVPRLIHQQWWFRILMTFLLVTLIYGLIKWKLKKAKHQNRLLEEKVKEQTLLIENEKKSLAESLLKQQQLTNDLKLIQESKNRMYAQISHEFKSPLQTVKIYLKNADNNKDPDVKNRIDKNINNLLSISDEILELSKAESGNLKVKKRFYNIVSLIKDQIDLKKPLLDEKNIDLRLQSSHEKYFIEIDIALIQKTIANLLSNAIKFSFENSKIDVMINCNLPKCLISVTDYGVGIKEEEIEHLTLPYYRASDNKQSGTGIGLSLVDQILILHDSKLDIKSALGKGSKFSFQLPMPSISQNEVTQFNLQKVKLDEQINKIINPNKPMILLVDDDIDILYFLKESLMVEYNVIFLTDGEAALQSLNQINPNLIISDVNMPLMSGITLLQEVRKIPKYTSIPFILLTGSISQEIEKQGIEKGVDNVLRKPITEEELHLKINQILNRKSVVEQAAKLEISHSILSPNIHGDDYILMQKIDEVILKNIKNSSLKSEDVADHLGMGEKTLRNRVKSITGLTVKEYLRNYRLIKAKSLIAENYGNLSEIAAAVGFSSLSYFSKCMKDYDKEIEER